MLMSINLLNESIMTRGSILIIAHCVDNLIHEEMSAKIKRLSNNGRNFKL